MNGPSLTILLLLLAVFSTECRGQDDQEVGEEEETNEQCPQGELATEKCSRKTKCENGFCKLFTKSSGNNVRFCCRRSVGTNRIRGLNGNGKGEKHRQKMDKAREKKQKQKNKLRKLKRQREQGNLDGEQYKAKKAKYKAKKDKAKQKMKKNKHKMETANDDDD
uniref:PTN_MK_C domain-containing protein n=1 Tax=Globodera pallida TaxID=36090 RepID=A0A183BRZ3_GLOPA